MAVSDGNTWGGRIIIRPEPDTTADRTTITGLGFTILGEDARAGETILWVSGTSAQVGVYISDFDQKFALPGHFFPIPKGEEVDLVRVKQWTSYKQIAY